MSISSDPTQRDSDAGMQVPATTWRFGLFTFDTVHGLRRGGRRVPLGSRALALLSALVRAGGELVDKRSLMQAVWPDAVVVENALHQHLRALRLALGDQGELVVSVSGRGYRLAATVESVDASAARPPGPLPLPGRPSPLIGRESLLAALAEAVAPGRCVTLLGATGVGKSRLALEFAYQHDRAGHTVAWCGLAGVERALELPGLLSAALGLAGGTTSLQQLTQSLRDSPLLLVLDNCEPLIEDCAGAVTLLLERCSRLAVLVTSQQPLQLAAERRLAVRSLSVPAADERGAVATLGPALELLLERTTALGVPPPRGADAAIARDLCRRLDGLPLALELAAPRVASLGWSATLDALASHFRLLSGRTRPGAPRHRSLDAAIAWSCAGLPPPLRRDWESLSVFRGGFTLAQAAGLLRPNSADRLAITAGVLAELVDRSLLQADPNTPAGTSCGQPARFGMHEGQRLHARARLTRRADAGRVTLRQVALMAECAESAEADWDQLSDAAWATRHGPDFDSVVAASQLAIEQQRPDLAARLLGSGFVHWHAVGGLQGFVALAADPRLAGVPSDEPGGARLALAHARSLLGEATDTGALREAAARAIALADRHLKPLPRAQARLCLASAAARAGDAELEAREIEAATQLLDAVPPGKTWGWCCQARGWALQLGGDLDDALAAVVKARDCWQRVGAWLDEGRAMVHIADLRLALGNVEGAIDDGEAAAARFAGTWHRQLLGRALANLGAAHAARGDRQLAVERLLAALDELAGSGFAFWVFDHLAALAASAGQPGAAARWTGFADAGYARLRSGRRLANEKRAHDMALDLAHAQLTAPQFAAEREIGRGADEARLVDEARRMLSTRELASSPS